MRRTFPLVLVALGSAIGVGVACSSSNDPQVALDAGASSSSGGSSSGASSSGASSSSSGASSSGSSSGGSSSSSGGDSGVPAEPNWLVHIADSPATIDLCWSTTAGVFSGEPILKSLGLPGVPKQGVSAPFTPPASAIWGGAGTPMVYFRVVDAATGSCATSVTEGNPLSLGKFRAVVYVGDGTTEVAQAQYGPTVAGKDSVYSVTRYPNRNSFYVTGGAETFISPFTSNAARLDPTTTGTIVTRSPPSAEITRPYKPLSGGLTLLMAFADKTLACDLLAPVAGLVPCSTSIREN